MATLEEVIRNEHPDVPVIDTIFIDYIHFMGGPYSGGGQSVVIQPRVYIRSVIVVESKPPFKMYYINSSVIGKNYAVPGGPVNINLVDASSVISQ